MFKIIFLGQKPIGEECFNLLVKKSKKFNWKIVAAVSNKSKHNWWKSNYIYENCKKNEIQFINNKKRNNKKIIEIIEKNKINLMISVGHQWIIPNQIIKALKGKAFNLHNAKLPDYKGFNSINHAILNGEKTYTSSIHIMSKNVDSGAIIFEKECHISKLETAISLYDKTHKNCRKIFLEFLKSLNIKKRFKLKKNIANGNFYGKNLIYNLKKININDDIETIKTKSRAFYFPPFEPAYLIIKDNRYYITPNNKKLI